MALVTEKQGAAFNLSEIMRGYLLWGRHRTWSEGKAGFVTAATEEQLTVQYYPGIGNVTNHFIIPVSEAADGQWEIRWSCDMSEIRTHGIPPGDGPGKTEIQEDGEETGNNDTGGTYS